MLKLVLDASNQTDGYLPTHQGCIFPVDIFCAYTFADALFVLSSEVELLWDHSQGTKSEFGYTP